jgi:hypothetical protein
MAAPAGNQFWKLRSKHGRDKIFASSEELWAAACEYFNWVDGHPWWKNEQLKKPYEEVDIETGSRRMVTTIKIATARPYTIQGLCLYLCCNTKYLNDFEDGLKGKEDEVSKAFSEIVTRIRETIYMQKFEGAAVGAFNSNIIARELGLSDKKDITTGGKALPPALNVTVAPIDIPIAEKEE